MKARPWFWASALMIVFLAVPAHAADKAVANVAHIKLSGDLDEAPIPENPLFGTGMENFRGKLDRIKKAKADKDIQALYLQLDGLHIGWGKVDELRRAIIDFRTSGKKAFAFIESGESKDYMIALACDEIALPESGWLMLTGMQIEVTFFKGLLDKLGIKADALKVGDFKGAVEPFILNKMSPEVRKNYESILEDFYDKSYVGAIVQFRAGKKFTPEQVRKIIDEGPYTAKKAKELGLVDRIAYADGFQDTMKTVLDAERVVVKRNYAQAKADDLDTSNPFALMMKLLKPPTPKESTKPKIAVIYAVGPITTGKGGNSLFGGDVVGSTTMVEAIRQAENDKTVKAIVLRVDSPGGSALASDLIWAELKRCKKPIIASMSDTAASGGYYICMAGQKIYAEPGTLTGSIGVFGMKLVLGELEDKVGLKTEVINRGANSGMMSSSTPFSASERKAMTALIDDVYDQFLTKALEGRKKAGKTMTRAELEKLAGGRVWTGRQAKEVGLIDELGTLDDAIQAAKDASNSKGEMELLILPKPKTFLDTLLDPKGADERLSMGLAALLRDMPELSKQLKTVDGLLRLRSEPVWMTTPYIVNVK
ncbi:MAG: signal peptide peptidase SppA [Gemmataceae bacterium]|nr:signal peptide peptidase SppA [Gemmataceae bacterium]